MLDFAKKYGHNITSQFGENGIIDEISNRLFGEFILGMGGTPLSAVEFGAPTKSYCSNIHPLDEKIWKKYWLDIDPQEPDIQKVIITTENINLLFLPPDLLSIDIDNDDYDVWKAYKGKPAVVIIEVNSSFRPPMEIVPGPRGASYYSMVKLGIEKGYFIVCHTGNCIFVLNKYRKLFPEIIGDGLSNFDLYFNTSHL